MDGTGPEIAFLSLRRHVPQIPRHRPSGERLEILPQPVGEGFRRVHHQQRLRTLHIGRHADRLPRPVRVGRRPADRGRPRPRLQQGAKRIPQQHLLLAEHLLRPSGADAQDRRQLSDGRRHALHGQGGLGNDGVPGRVPEPRSASGAIDPHAGLHAHQLHQGRSAEPVDLHDGLSAHQVRRSRRFRFRRVQPLVHRPADHPHGRDLPQLRRSQSRAGYADAGRHRSVDQETARSRRYAQSGHGSRQRQPRPVPFGP